MLKQHHRSTWILLVLAFGLAIAFAVPIPIPEENTNSDNEALNRDHLYVESRQIMINPYEDHKAIVLKINNRPLPPVPVVDNYRFDYDDDRDGFRFERFDDEEEIDEDDDDDEDDVDGFRLDDGDDANVKADNEEISNDGQDAGENDQAENLSAPPVTSTSTTTTTTTTAKPAIVEPVLSGKPVPAQNKKPDDKPKPVSKPNTADVEDDEDYYNSDDDFDDDDYETPNEVVSGTATVNGVIYKYGNDNAKNIKVIPNQKRNLRRQNNNKSPVIITDNIADDNQFEDIEYDEIPVIKSKTRRLPQNINHSRRRKNQLRGYVVLNDDNANANDDADDNFDDIFDLEPLKYRKKNIVVARSSSNGLGRQADSLSTHGCRIGNIIVTNYGDQGGVNCDDVSTLGSNVGIPINSNIPIGNGAFLANADELLNSGNRDVKPLIISSRRHIMQQQQQQLLEPERRFVRQQKFRRVVKQGERYNQRLHNHNMENRRKRRRGESYNERFNSYNNRRRKLNNRNNKNNRRKNDLNMRRRNGLNTNNKRNRRKHNKRRYYYDDLY